MESRPDDRPSYWWEAEDAADDGAADQVWCASVDDFATGDGLSVHFAAGLACGEAAFRRRIALELGRELANFAHVRERSAGGVPFEPMFLSANLDASLDAFDRGEGRPAVMTFFAKYHANYS